MVVQGIKVEVPDWECEARAATILSLELLMSLFETKKGP